MGMKIEPGRNTGMVHRIVLTPFSTPTPPHSPVWVGMPAKSWHQELRCLHSLVFYYHFVQSCGL